MSSRILGLSAALAVLLTTSTIASATGAPSSSYPAVTGAHRYAGLRLPKELKMLWRRQEHAQLKAMPKEQRRGWLKSRWSAMSDQQKQAKLAELQKKWDSLPESVHQRLLERKREKHEARRMQREEGGMSSRDSSRSMQP